MEHPNPLASYTLMDDTSSSDSTHNTVSSQNDYMFYALEAEMHTIDESDTEVTGDLWSDLIDSVDLDGGNMEEDYRVEALGSLTRENLVLHNRTQASVEQLEETQTQKDTHELLEICSEYERLNDAMEKEIAEKNKKIEELNRKLNDDSFTISHEDLDNESLRSRNSELIGDKKLLEEENRILLASLQEKEADCNLYLGLIDELTKKIKVLRFNQGTAVTLVDEVENDLPKYGAGDDNQNSSVIDDYLFSDTSSSDEGDVSEESETENVFNEPEVDLPKYGAGDDNQNSSVIDGFCDTSSTSDADGVYKGGVSEESETKTETENGFTKGELNADPEVIDVDNIIDGIDRNENDIICGAGQGNIGNPGNKNYLNMINANLNLFAESWHQKFDTFGFAKKIYNIIKSWNPPHRFLKKLNNSDELIELTDYDATKKIVKALLTKTREVRLAKYGTI